MSNPEVINAKNSSTYTDTDSEAVRIVRARNQMKLYGLDAGSERKIDDFKGESVVERFLGIREVLFPSNNFQSIDQENNPPNQLINRTFDIEDEFYPRIQKVSEELLPNLYKLIDEVYEEIAAIEDPKKKEEAAFRLVSVIYVIGIIIHPSSNGNGQTFKMLVLSYLHELTNQFKDRYFPLKYSHRLRSRDQEIVGFAERYAQLSVPQIVPKMKEDELLLEMFRKILDVRKERVYSPNMDWEKFDYELNLEILRIVKEYSDRLNLPELLEFDVYEDKISKNEVLGKVPAFAIHEIRIKLMRIFDKKSYEKDEIMATFWIDTPKIARVTSALSTLLSGVNNPNVRLLKDYILGNAVDLSLTDKHGEYVFSAALGTFNAVDLDIRRLLTDDTISSEAAIRNQRKLADRYEKIINVIEDIRSNDYELWSDITDALYLSPKYKTDEQKISYLEKVVRKYELRKGK